MPIPFSVWNTFLGDEPSFEGNELLIDRPHSLHGFDEFAAGVPVQHKVGDQLKVNLKLVDIIPISRVAFPKHCLLMRPTRQSTNPRFDNFTICRGHRRLLLAAATFTRFYTQKLSESASKLLHMFFEPRPPRVSPPPFFDQPFELVLCRMFLSI
jgi:hypothetical protein